MPEKLNENDRSNAAASGDGASLDDLRQQIEDHRKHDSSASALKRVVGYVWGKDDDSLKGLEELYGEATRRQKAGDAAGVADLTRRIGESIKADQNAVETQEEIGHYSTGFLKATGLFMRGKIGLAGTVAIYALDQINPDSDARTMGADLVMGGAKGFLLKQTFEVMGGTKLGVAHKGIVLGGTSRALEFGLTRQTYSDAAGEFNLGTGLRETVLGTLNYKSMAADAAIFGVSHGLFKGANTLAGGAIERSPLLSTMLTGTTFGMSAGATGEIMRQDALGEQFDLGKVVKRSLIQGALDTFAAAPGGIQADPGMRARIGDYGRGVKRGVQSDFALMRQSVLNLADSLTLPMDGGLQPAFAVAGGGRIPRDYRSVRPGTGSKTDGVMMMASGGHGPTNISGANVEGLLTGAARPEPPIRVEDVAKIGAVKHTVEPPADAVKPAEALKPADALKPAAREAGDGSLLGGAKVQPAEVIRVRSPEEARTFEEFTGVLKQTVAPEAGDGGRRQLFDFLRRHPEMEIPIRQYEKETWEALTRQHRPGEFGAQEILEMRRTVELLNEFYRPERPRLLLDHPVEGQFVTQMRQFLAGLHNPSTRSFAKTNLFDFLNVNPSFHPVAKRYAAGSNSTVEVEALDQYFGTQHVKAVRDLQEWRANPERFLAAQKVAAGPVVLGPGETLNPDGSVVKAPAAVSTAPAADLMVERTATGPAADGTEPVSPLTALGRAKPLAAVGEVPADAVAPPEAQMRLPLETPLRTPLEAPPEAPLKPPREAQPVERTVAPEPAVNAQPGTVTASELALGLADPSVAVRSRTVRVLSDHVNKLTDAEFTVWKNEAADGIMLGYILKRPDVEALPPAVLKRFLAKAEAPSADAPVPEWAVEHVEHSKALAAERALTDTRPARPPRAPRDTMQDRLGQLEKTLDTFKDQPQIGARLIELCAGDKAALDALVFALGHPKAGEAYKKLVAQIAPNIESIEPLKYLFQFMKERNNDGALAALKQLRPEVKLETAEEIYERLLNEQSQTAEGADPLRLLEQAQQLFQSQVARPGDEWGQMQRLVYDIMSGNIQGPPRPGGPGGRGGPRGGPGGPRGGDRGGRQ